LPATPYDAKGLLRSAIRENNPVMFIEHKLLYFTTGDVPDGEYLLPIGKAEVKREGTDVTIVGISRSVLHALQAAEQLAQEGISAEVIDPRTIRPMDFETILKSVQKTHRLVLVHEAVQFGSILGEIAATIQERAFDFLDAPIMRVGGADSPVAYSQPLEQAQLPNADTIIAAVKNLM
ncbi:MAG TPA: transketolase C-terminal domain-containing protein, partial [Anaerolineae bacterium]|nr:transketolase C-terminal domain-containing protein [Anaerolineae bacterium]